MEKFFLTFIWIMLSIRAKTSLAHPCVCVCVCTEAAMESAQLCYLPTPQQQQQHSEYMDTQQAMAPGGRGVVTS